MAIDFGDILDKTLNAYQTVSVARAEADTAKYERQGAIQARELHSSEGVTPLEAYHTGNAADPARNNLNYFDRIPKPLLYGSLALLGGVLVVKAFK